MRLLRTLGPAAATTALAASLVACADTALTTPREAGARVCRDAPVALAVGQVAVPEAAGATRCLLAPIVGAEYALVWVDTRAIDAARLGAEPIYEPYPVGLSIAPDADLRDGIAELRSSGLLHAADPSSGLAAESAPRLLKPASTDDGVLESRPRNRRTPWVLDELFLLEDRLSGLPRQARVIRVYGGRTVVVRWESAPTENLAPFLAQLDTAHAIVTEAAEPLMRQIFSATPPSSSQAGQFLILVQQEIASQATSYAEVSGDTMYNWMDLYPFVLPSAVRLASLFAHELAHAYQHQYMHGSRSAPNLPTLPAASFWAYEGGANLMTYEMMRRLSGIPLDANHDWRAPPANTATSIYQQRAQPAGGVLTEGFDHAMGFLRDLTLRRMAQGESADAALRAVSRGAIEGWFGFDGVATRTGLAARMRNVLGSRWEPADAVLDWALSHAGDDLTPNQRYQDRASLRVWDIPAGQGYGWRPDAILTRAAPTFFLFKRYGSPGWLRVTDDGAGLSVEIRGFEVPIRWKILRTR
jgi:hypothetical protein